MNLAQRISRLRSSFVNRYGGQPDTWVRAPGRVDLMGSHTDYNQGSVLTLAINRDTWLAARRRDDATVHAISLNLDSAIQFSIGEHLPSEVAAWGKYVYAVTQTMHQAGYPVCGFDAVLHGTVPIASGLSSSASLEAATATLLARLAPFAVSPLEQAKLCQRAENEIVGVKCGILDQYSSILGEIDAAIVLDCRHLTHRYAAFPRGLRIVICNTCAPRGLAGSAYGERRASCERVVSVLAARRPGISALRDVPLQVLDSHMAELDPVDARRARFILEENARVELLAEALADDDRPGIRRLAAASFAGARDLFEISIPAMEAMYDSMTAAPGAVGARQAGAGFGGCMVAFVEVEAMETFCQSVAASYAKTTGIVPEIYPVRPALGAGPLELPDE